jgi:hypothetical protein
MRLPANARLAPIRRPKMAALVRRRWLADRGRRPTAWRERSYLLEIGVVPSLRQPDWSCRSVVGAAAGCESLARAVHAGDRGVAAVADDRRGDRRGARHRASGYPETGRACRLPGAERPPLTQGWRRTAAPDGESVDTGAAKLYYDCALLQPPPPLRAPRRTSALPQGVVGSVGAL